MTGRPSCLAQLEVLRAAAGRDVDDAGALLLADLVPGDDAVLVGGAARRRAARERRPHGRQLVERARGSASRPGRAPGPLLEHLEAALRSAVLSVPLPSQ